MIIRVRDMKIKTMPAKPVIKSNSLLKSNFSSGKGWKNRINRKTPIVMPARIFISLFSNLTNRLDSLYMSQN
jgi:hypothetical protein